MSTAIIATPRPRAMRFRQLRTPTFRARLRLFFVVIVVVPMITMAVVLFQLIVASERSQTDARLSEAQTVAHGTVQGGAGGGRRRPRPTSAPTSSSPTPSSERRGRRAAAARPARQATPTRGTSSCSSRPRDVRGGLAAGRGAGRAAAGRRQRQADRPDHGRDALARAVRGADLQLTAAEVVVVESGDQPLATTQPDAARRAARPRAGRRSAASTTASRRSGARRSAEPIEVSLLMPDRDTASPTSTRVAGGR